jgi:hypothetical protein
MWQFITVQLSNDEQTLLLYLQQSFLQGMHQLKGVMSRPGAA